MPTGSVEKRPLRAGSVPAHRHRPVPDLEDRLPRSEVLPLAGIPLRVESDPLLPAAPSGDQPSYAPALVDPLVGELGLPFGSHVPDPPEVFARCAHQPG